jgi:ribosomal peptide maturation radical SAM protein 1
MPFGVALVAMPWPLADRPSIQLGALKAYLLQRFRGAVRVRAMHPFVPIAAHLGLDLYQKIAARSWLAEAIYAPLLFPEQLVPAQSLVDRLGGRKLGGSPLDLEVLGHQIQEIHRQDRLFEQLAEASLVGISVCLAQLTASLYLVRELKRRSPHVAVVLGGSSVCGGLGRSLLRVFPEIDLVVDGEGEVPLAALVERMLNAPNANQEPIPGLLDHSCADDIAQLGNPQIPSLANLPTPDFSDYFMELKACPKSSQWMGQLPIETSRGCYWQGATLNTSLGGCQFCNLNLQWQGYRSKRPRQVAQELARQAQTHKILRFCFVDNTLNPGQSLALFKELQRLGLGLELFAELRGPLSRESFREMRQAGMKQVQIGIEALSTRLLKKMNKGLRAIDNIEMMKWCEAFGIRNQSNLLLEFPGSDAIDVADTLATMEFVAYYKPLKAVRFWLGEGSPIHLQAEAFGLHRVKNHPWYRAWFPADVLARLCLMVKGYSGDQVVQRKLWQPIRQQVARWQKHYQAVRQAGDGAPLLGYSDGGSFLVVRRRMDVGGHVEAFRFGGRSREIFLYCDTGRHLEAVCQRFHPFSPKKIEHFIDELRDKRLAYREGDRVLTLAVNEDIRACAGPPG